LEFFFKKRKTKLRKREVVCKRLKGRRDRNIGVSREGEKCHSGKGGNPCKFFRNEKFEKLFEVDSAS
jgi:hypothetical protein